MINIVCVLKSGGDFDERYVYNLRGALLKNITQHRFTFYCFSDLKIPTVDVIPLQYDLLGWWSKLEIFSLTGPVLYFDLDTILKGSLTNLIKDVERLDNSFMMLEAFSSTRKYASGIIAWNGNWSWLVQATINNKEHFIWDQDCISYTLENANIDIEVIPRDEYGIVSWKHHCQKEIPENANIICFHGKPRPHEVLENW